MNFSPNRIYHIYNQGNNRQTIFHTSSDYLIFISLYNKLIHPVCSTIAWNLMPNHFHFIIHTDERCTMKKKQGGLFLDPITNGIRKLLSGYARIFNAEYKQTGSLFRQKTKAKCLSEIKISPDNPHIITDSYINCFHYVHQKPLIAKLTLKLEDWEYSSFRDYAGLREGNICNKELAAEYCGYNPENFLELSYQLVEKKYIDRIR